MMVSFNSVTPATAGAALGKLRAMAKAGRVAGKVRGQRRWYYCGRRGLVPYLELSDDAARQLEQGKAAIAESDRGEAWLVTSACAAELSAIDPTWVRS